MHAPTGDDDEEEKGGQNSGPFVEAWASPTAVGDDGGGGWDCVERLLSDVEALAGHV
jgi:hypothetical protein